MYTSTAYSNYNRAKIEEMIYPTSIIPRHAIERLATIRADDVLAFTQTYSIFLTKASVTVP